MHEETPVVPAFGEPASDDSAFGEPASDDSEFGESTSDDSASDELRARRVGDHSQLRC